MHCRPGDYHHWDVSEPTQHSTILELAGGRGGDLHKIRVRQPKEVLLVDIDRVISNHYPMPVHRIHLSTICLHFWTLVHSYTHYPVSTWAAGFGRGSPAIRQLRGQQVRPVRAGFTITL